MSVAMRPVMTLEQAAEVLECSESTVKRLIAANKLASITVGEALRRITETQLREYLRRCELEAAKAMAGTTDAPSLALVEPPPGPPPATPTQERPAPTLRVVPRVESFEAIARELTGTSGASTGSHSRQRGTRRSTSSGRGKRSTSGDASSKGGA